MKKVVFIIHGKLSCRQSLTKQLLKIFNPTYQTEFHITAHRGHAREIAFTATNTNTSFIICIGGDGTLNEIINGVADALPLTSQRKLIRIGLLPYGTGNDFSRTIQVTRSAKKLKQLMDQDQYRDIDLGEAEFVLPSGESQKRLFINIADVGIGGYIVQLLDNSSKRLGAFLTYQSTIIRAFFSFRKQPVKVQTDGWQYEGKAMEVLVANGSYIGGGLCIAPGAQPDDGKFLVALGGDISLWDYLKNIRNILRGEKINHPEAYYHAANEIKIDSLSGPLPVDMDGDFIGYTPLNIRIVPRAICFLC